MGSSYDSAPARRSRTNVTATLNTHGPIPKARSTSLPPSEENSHWCNRYLGFVRDLSECLKGRLWRMK